MAISDVGWLDRGCGKILRLIPLYRHIPLSIRASRKRDGIWIIDMQNRDGRSANSR